MLMALQPGVVLVVAGRWLGERPSPWHVGWTVIGIVESPIQGPAGNREFLLYARRGG